jgi:glutaconyl-CoA/methylmalonyl-CoA decarboxylase subunit gamma
MHRYTIEIDGRRFVIDVEERGAERFAVQVDGHSFDVTLAGREELGADAVHVVPSAAVAAATVTQPRPVHAAAPLRTYPPSDAAESNGVLRAAMPGVILRVLVAPGTIVRRGQDLAVLEAMKMENIIRAPQDATVAEVLVKPGQHVGHGEALVRLEPATS